MFARKRYKFTKKITPKKAIMSDVLGLIAICAEVLIIYLSYTLRGEIPNQYGAVFLMSLIFAIIGMVLAVWSITYKQIYRFCSILGIVLNAIAIFIIIFIMNVKF